MPISDRRSLRQQAADALRSAPNAGKLVLLFAGVTAGLALAAGIVTTILDSRSPAPADLAACSCAARFPPSRRC
jgi:hypothetical protein